MANDGVEVLDAWRPCRPSITNGTDNRSPDNYVKVIQQFHVATNPRYTPRDHNTFCNIFVSDVTAALCAEVPHWVLADGTPSQMGRGHELNANAVAAWLEQQGPHYGWSPCTAPAATANAALGCPTVVVWHNEGGCGHVAMVLPNGNIAQAGGSNFYDKPVAAGFGSQRLGLVRYYKHS